MRIDLDRELVKEILIQETFYNTVPEYFFLKEAGAKIVEAISREGGCTSCTENNLINPTIMAFISHTVNMYLYCEPSSMDKLKLFIKDFKDIKESFSIIVLYKENEETEIVELSI